jgi:hypothetical protein
MAYVSTGLIEATDYNGFVSTNTENVNRVWGVGTGDAGYGQTALSTVSSGATVTATNWASLVNTISSTALHQGTAITARTAPTTGNLIQILTNLATDITNTNNNRGNAAASGAEITAFTGTTSKTTITGSGQNAWTITFTHTVTFPSANQARYFWNAGGIVRLRVSKSSTGRPADAEWNDLAGTLMNEIRIVGRVNNANQVISGVTYTGVNKTVGTGTPTTFLSGTGWYQLTTTNIDIYRQFADTYPYTGQFINVAARTAGTGTQLILTTTWTDPGSPVAPGRSDVITGGTATNSPFTAFGTAPATVVTVIPPSSTNITNTWGTPTIAATTA